MLTDIGQPVCRAKLLEADQIRVPMPLDQEKVGWEGVGVVLEGFLGVAVGSGGFRLGAGRAGDPSMANHGAMPGPRFG